MNLLTTRLNSYFSHPGVASAPRNESVSRAFSTRQAQTEEFESYVQADNGDRDLDPTPGKVRFAADSSGVQESAEWRGHVRSGSLQTESKAADGSFCETTETRFGPFGLEKRQVVETPTGVTGLYESVDVSEHQYCYSQEFFIPAATLPSAPAKSQK